MNLQRATMRSLFGVASAVDGHALPAGGIFGRRPGREPRGYWFSGRQAPAGGAHFTPPALVTWTIPRRLVRAVQKLRTDPRPCSP